MSIALMRKRRFQFLKINAKPSWNGTSLILLLILAQGRVNARFFMGR
jgi:hypothetical protein